MRKRGAGPRGGVWTGWILGIGAAWMLIQSLPGGATAVGGFVPGLWPLGPRVAANAAGSLAAAGLGIAFLIVCDAVGLGVLHWISRVRPRGVVRMAAPLAGFGAISLGLLGSAAASLWFPPVLVGGLAAAALGTSRRLPAVCRGWVAAGREAWTGLPFLGKSAAVIGIAWAAILLVPPEVHVDSLEYSLACPQQWLLAHRLIGSGTYRNWEIPLAADLPNVYALLAGRDPAAKVFHAVFALLGALALARALGLRPLSATGLAAAGLGIILPRGASALFTAKNDAMVSAAALLALALAIRGCRATRFPPRSLAVCGIAAGLLVSIKFPLAPFAAVLLGLLLLRLPARRRTGAWVFAVSGLVPFLPWMARSWLLTADPVYPVLTASVPGFAGDAEAGRATRQAIALVYDSGRRYAAWPWETIRLAVINALPAFAILPVIRRLRPLAVRDVLAVSAVSAGCLVGSVRFGLDVVERFAAPAFAAADVAALCVVLGGTGAGWRAARAAAAVLGFAAVLHATAAQLGSHPGTTAALIAGRIAPEDFRIAATGSYGRAIGALGAAVAGRKDRGRVLEVGEKLGWGIPVRVIGQGLGPALPWRSARECASERRIAVRFRQSGVRWILYNSWKADWDRMAGEPYAWTPRMLEVYAAFVRDRLRLVWADGRDEAVWGCLWLYAVDGRGPATGELGEPGRVLFLPGAERALAAARIAERSGDAARAIAELETLHALLPGVMTVESALGHALVRARRWPEAYPFVRRTIDAGLIDDCNLLDWAIVSGHLGRHAEAAEAIRRAKATCRGWDELIEYASLESGAVR